MTRVTDRSKRGSPAFGVSAIAAFESGAQIVPRRSREQRFDAEAIDVVPRVAIRRRIGHGRTRPDDAEIVADDVRDRETDGRPRCRRRKTAAFDGRQVFANRIERGDVGARPSAAHSPRSACLRASGLPAGTAIKADAPPESSTTSVSPGSVRCATSSARRPAATLRSSGSGWLDGIHSSCARQRDRQVGADDDAVANPIARNPGERVGHERRGLADGNDAQRLPCRREAIAGSWTARSIRWCGDAASMAPRAMVRKCWRKCDRGDVSVNVLRIGPARQPRHDVELPQQPADDLIGVFLG